MADGANSNERWFSAAELAGLSGLPSTPQNITARAKRDSWSWRARQGRGGGKEYAFASLPLATQASLFMRDKKLATRLGKVPTPTGSWTTERIESALRSFENASASLRATAERKVRALHAVNGLQAAGLALMEARAQVAAELKRDGVRGSSVASLMRWASEVERAPANAWAAILLPAYVGSSARAACDEQCWDWYKGHYLTRAKPTHADSFGRLRDMAREQGWTIPSAKTLMRRMDTEVRRTTQVLLREGTEAAARLLPKQKRDASVFGAGEAVNGDGLKFDRLWVRFEDGEIINTATAWFYQDLRTRRLLAWRLAKTENTDLFRLATYDLTGVCAPEHIWVDNTRVAANKLMTAGACKRYRFGEDPDDGLGLLMMVGAQVHFTNPDKQMSNPGAKPIERAFGIGGVHHAVATNPRFIDRGFSRATAIDVAELREVIKHEVARHNAKEGRRTDECRGVMSFDQAWEAAQRERPARVLSDTQRRLLLMAREVVKADRNSGTLTINAGRGPNGANRYWCEHLTQLGGRKLAVHFDPENLSAGVHVYGLDGRYLFAADHQPSYAFNATEESREFQKNRARKNKAEKIAAAAEVRMNALERAALYQSATGAPEPPKPTRNRGEKVVQGVFQRPVDPARDAVREQRTGTDDGRDSAGRWCVDIAQERKRRHDAGEF